MRNRRRLVPGALLAIVVPLIVAAQTDTLRTIVPEAFIKARPAAPARPATAPVYTRLPGRRPVPANGQTQDLGITLWRLRPATAGDSVRLLVQEPQAATEWTPQRVSVGTVFREGDRVRVSIESPREGYLYVVDRERYANNTSGEPYLIFPTSRTRGGDNRVVAGRLIEIPAQTDGPPYFTLQASRPDQVAEAITVILTHDPLPGITAGATPLRLKEETVADWERRGGAVAERLELVGGVGRRWSTAEQRAGADTTRLLSQQDPPPQTVFRVVTSEPAIVAAQFTLAHARGRGAAAPAVQPSTQQPAR